MSTFARRAAARHLPLPAQGKHVRRQTHLGEHGAVEFLGSGMSRALVEKARQTGKAAAKYRNGNVVQGNAHGEILVSRRGGGAPL
jgi:uncharacterized Fe-S center protein